MNVQNELMKAAAAYDREAQAFRIISASLYDLMPECRSWVAAHKEAQRLHKRAVDCRRYISGEYQ